MKIDFEFIDSINNYFFNFFNFNINKSKLNLYTKERWDSFCNLNNFDKKSFGLYVPKNLSAHVNTENKFLISNIFHEFFGHGLFYENSLIGRDFKNNKKIENRGISKNPVLDSEGFALLIEEKLCYNEGLINIWKEKYSQMNKTTRNIHSYFKDIEKNYGRLSILGSLELPKYYNKKQIKDTIKKTYKNIETIDFILLYGSKKPYSDIDLFVVSGNQTNNFKNKWLDVYEVNRTQFKNWASKLDISITDPIITGELIYGDINYFENVKKQILKEEITKKAIDYNLQEVKRLKRLQRYHKDKTIDSYVESFLLNAQMLSKGIKPLTLKNLRELNGKPTKGKMFYSKSNKPPIIINQNIYK